MRHCLLEHAQWMLSATPGRPTCDDSPSQRMSTTSENTKFGQSAQIQLLSPHPSAWRDAAAYVVVSMRHLAKRDDSSNAAATVTTTMFVFYYSAMTLDERKDVHHWTIRIEYRRVRNLIKIIDLRDMYFPTASSEFHAFRRLICWICEAIIQLSILNTSASSGDF